MLESPYNTALDQNIIDENTLNALSEAIGEEAMHDFLNRFFEDCRARTGRITEAYGNAHFSEVELEAHTLGTSSATYGALKLEEICREIEFAKPGKNQAFQDRIDRLNILSEQSLEGLRKYAAQAET